MSRDESESDGYLHVQAISDDEIDISSALAGGSVGKPGGKGNIHVDDSDDGLQEMIRSSITKRDVKGGTAVLKKTKGNTKIAKGEVGGGSFQSMGTCVTIYVLKEKICDLQYSQQVSIPRFYVL
jgi:ATP-dependent RNA helicase DDX54/DBP10